MLSANQIAVSLQKQKLKNKPIKWPVFLHVDTIQMN